MNTFLAVLAAVAAHEFAHVIATEMSGLTVLDLRWKWFVCPGIRRTQGSPRQHFLIAAAGPAMSLFLAWAFWTSWNRLAWISLLLAVSSLLPWSSSDGARMLRAWENMRSGYQPYTRRG
jgi:Zn-dependent protease